MQAQEFHARVPRSQSLLPPRLHISESPTQGRHTALPQPLHYMGVVLHALCVAWFRGVMT